MGFYGKLVSTQLLENYYVLTSSVDHIILLSMFAKVVKEPSKTDIVSYKYISIILQFTIELYNELSLGNVDVKRELYASMLHAHRIDIIKLLKEKTGLLMESSKGLVELSHCLDCKMGAKVALLHTRTLEEPEIMLLCSEPCENTVNSAEGTLTKLTTPIGKSCTELGRILRPHLRRCSLMWMTLVVASIILYSSLNN